MKLPLNQTWNLETIFENGSKSNPFSAFIEEIEQDIALFRQQLAQMETPQSLDDSAALQLPIERLQSISARLKEAVSFTACLTSQDQNDRNAVLLSGKLQQLSASFISALTLFERLLTSIPDALWEALLEQEAYSRLAFILDERRRLALEKMPSELESLAADLAVDGYHGWGELYNTAVSRMEIPFGQQGEIQKLSVGQAHNILHSPDREVRGKMFAEWEKAWSDQAYFCSDALNHLSGFRLQLYKHRNWSSVLKEPLEINRMSKQTLEKMWEVINQNKELPLRYLKRKTEMLGLQQLSWHDVEAPIGSDAEKISYDEAAQIILEQFRKFSPQMADFSQMAFEQRWIEAEDRPGKRPGGFCTSFPVSKQTRIFMTFGGTLDNVSTLAHELGHAYHQHVMNDLPELLQDYAMNVAETASTFAEMIVSAAAVKLAKNREQKLALLENKVQNTVTFFMNIQARFLFELSFYEERRKGLVSIEQLNRLMEEAQKQAFDFALAEYHPHFWASKLHFYITETPFYNFPYTFGFMFSAGIYAIALKEGPQFEARYVDLLRDTGAMTVEDLARKHLGVNLSEADFWQGAIDLLLTDIDEFLQMTEEFAASK